MTNLSLPEDDDLAPAVTQAEQAVRNAPDDRITPSEKQALAREASREEDA